MPARFTRFAWMRRFGLGLLLVSCVTAIVPAQDDPAAGEDDSGIPPGLLQKREIRPEFELDKPLISDGEEAEFKKKGGETQLHNALKASSPNEEEKKALDAGARWYVYRLSMAKYREEETTVKDKTSKSALPKERLPDLRTRLLNTIRSFAGKPTSAGARDYFQKQVVARCEELLDNNFHVRLNAVLLLGQLSTNDGNLARGIEPPAFAPAYPVLLKVVQDEKQHEAIRVAAALGLTRICRTALNPDTNDKRRGEIALPIADILAKNKSHWWLQMRLCEVLAAAGISADSGDKTNPVILQTLAKVMSDRTRHWEVRVEAARAIGRLPLEGITVAPITYQMVNLGNQLALAYNANPRSDSWTKYFWKLYLAFKRADQFDKVVGDRRKPGLLDALPNSKEIKDAYEQILLISNVGLDPNAKQFSAEQLKSLQEWLNSHKAAANGGITAGGPSIASPAADKSNADDQSARP